MKQTPKAMLDAAVSEVRQAERQMADALSLVLRATRPRPRPEQKVATPREAINAKEAQIHARARLVQAKARLQQLQRLQERRAAHAKGASFVRAGGAGPAKLAEGE